MTIELLNVKRFTESKKKDNSVYRIFQILNMSWKKLFSNTWIYAMNQNFYIDFDEHSPVNYC